MNTSHRPNIVFILADDLGHGMLSCYGQSLIRTPNIDRLAQQGTRFTQAYGAAFCAPSRACLLTGMHDCHAGRWTFNKGGLYGDYAAGRLQLDEISELINHMASRGCPDRDYLPNVLKSNGYATGQIGKLEWGFSTTAEEIFRHGWDYHYGYYDHGQCHGFYPPFLFENGKRVDIPGNNRSDFGRGPIGPFTKDPIEHDSTGREVYSQDLFDEKIKEYLRLNHNQPFFLYHPSQLPHGPIYFPEIPPELASNPHLTPVEREYAAMVLRLDKTVGIILDELDDLGIANNTIVLFASDNGHFPYYDQPGRSRPREDLQGNPLDQITSRFTTAGCGDVFNGNGGLSGIKATNWEGGARVPFIIRWPREVIAGGVSNHMLAIYDTLATLAHATGSQTREPTDGISFLPAATGNIHVRPRRHIVYASQFGPSIVTADRWKLRTFLRKDQIIDFNGMGSHIYQMQEAFSWQLYNLEDDPSEQIDLVAEQPRIGEQLFRTLLEECDGNLVHGTPQAHFAFSAWSDPPKPSA